MENSNNYCAFLGSDMLFQGDLNEVVLKTKKKLGSSPNSEIHIFSDATGKILDFNFQGTDKDVLKRLEVYTTADSPKEPSGPGRPKLGVMSREVTLLPRHWEWLATQSGGASSTLRKLVEDHMKKSSGQHTVKQAQERTYKFMSALAGDLPGYEEALRALYKKDEELFNSHMKTWPKDVRHYAIKLAKYAF